MEYLAMANGDKFAVFKLFGDRLLERWDDAVRAPEMFVEAYCEGFSPAWPFSAALKAELEKIKHLERQEAVAAMTQIVTKAKPNKGKKIKLETADRLYCDLLNRLHRINRNKEFGVAVPLVLLFGSYMRRESVVGDIDIAALLIYKRSHQTRKRYFWERGQNNIEGDEAPYVEVQKAIRNRSGWISLHSFDDVRPFPFKVAYAHWSAKKLAKDFENGLVGIDTFFDGAEQIRRHACKYA
jgi:hypothetical protein